MAAPRDDLLRLVPGDFGFCLVLEDLSGHGKAFANSPFIKQFRESPLAAKVIDAQEAQKLGLVDQFLQQYLRMTAEQLRDDILGDALVLAYRPGPPDKPGEEEGLFLLRARNPKLLADLVERLNTLQKDSGDLKDIEERGYGGKKYFARTESISSNFYYLRGPLLAFASREETLKRMIDLDQKSAAEESALAREYRLAGVGNPLASLWVNPRAFDRLLEKKAGEAKGGQARALQTLLKYWQCLDAVALSIDLQESFEIKVSVRARANALPLAAQRYLSAAAAPSDLWRHFPENALFAIAGRTDVQALVDLLGDFLADEARRSIRTAVEQSAGAVFGKQAVGNTLAALGPDWGLCIVAPPSSEKAWPAQVTAALRIQRGKNARPADLTVINGLNALAAMAVFSHNAGKPGSLSLNSVLQDNVEVRYLENEQEFPPGFRPAFAVKGGYLVVAGSPELVRRFRSSPSSAGRGAAANEFPLVRLSVKELSRYLTDRRSIFVDLGAKQHHIPVEEAESKLNGLLSVLQFIDRVDITQRSDPNRAILTLQVRTTQPLK
jgi:enoyl-CoA hydratase/carnithine racemase